MLMKRMRDVRVHVQARLINEMEKIQYVAHLHGVQIVGRIPTYMRQVTLKKAEASKLKIGSKSEKISRYVKFQMQIVAPKTTANQFYKVQ